MVACGAVPLGWAMVSGAVTKGDGACCGRDMKPENGASATPLPSKVLPVIIEIWKGPS